MAPEVDDVLRWRELTDADRQLQYSPSSCTGGTFQPFIDEYLRRSDDAFGRAEAGDADLRTLRYGSEAAQTVDVFLPPAADHVPIIVYIHGGYWQLLSKRDSTFAAFDAVGNGWAYAAVDYTLAPHASLDQIVDECRAAVSVLREEAANLGVDGDRFFVCGSSAGAHLSAMVGLGLDDGWRPAGLGLVSGVYELEPLIGTSINDAVGLDLGQAHRNSPLLVHDADLASFPPAVITWGENETDEFKRQSRALYRRLTETGAAVEQPGDPSRSTVMFEVPNRNHFDVILDLCDLRTDLGKAIGQLVG